MIDIPGLSLRHVATHEYRVTCSVVVDGNDLGRITFVECCEPRAKALGAYIALWAGTSLCVIDRSRAAMRCIDRDDEAHGIQPFDGKWIVEGELTIDLFDPADGTTSASYDHGEVIISTTIANDLIHGEDFDGATFVLDPRKSLQVVTSG